MRHGVLTKVRRPGAAIALWVWALSLLVPAWPQRAEANLDPLRIVTTQIIKPNILILLDTSGSMAWRADQSVNVGGDCYNGSNCVTTPQANTCPDGTGCLGAGTCVGGEACTATPGYCTDGSACSNGSLCGSGASSTLCPSSSNTCRDGSGCQHSCSVNNAICSTSADCTQQSCNVTTYTPTYNTLHTCSNNGATCTTDANCGNTSCFGTCSGGTKSGKTCSTSTDCPGGGSCKTSSSYRNCQTGVGVSASSTSCSSVGSVCNTCNTSTVLGSSYCTKSPYTVCNDDSDCAGWSNHCATSAFNVGKCSADNGSCSTATDCASNTCGGAAQCNAGTTGSSVCGLWCADHSQCSAPQTYCTSSSGAHSACAQVCPDGGTCYATQHCGNATTCGTFQYKGSSRLATAKHVISNVVDATNSLANFGFETYDQTNYFPYVKSATTTTITKTACFGQSDLQSYSAWSNGPTNTFTRNGTLYTIVATGGSGNSNYATGSHHHGYQSATHDYCGTQCSFSSSTWSFQSACYTYPQTQNSGTLTYSYQSTYQGDSISISGNPYNYYPFTPTDDGPISGEGSSWTCSSTARADGNVRVSIDLTDTTAARTATQSNINAWLQPMTKGGLVPADGTPTGCSLQYNYASSGVAPALVGSTHDAYSYLKTVQDSDTLKACRNNFVILVTDGEPNGPGDSQSACEDSACQGADLSSCTCASVLAARHLKDDLGVKTYAIGFGSEASGAPALDNIARAGGTCRSNGCAFSAGDESSLTDALEAAIFDAVKGDYATSAPTVATSSGSAFAGDIALLASTEFPSWNGHLRATDVVHLDTNGAPTLVWDAGQLLAARDWTTRTVYTSDPSSNAIVPFQSAPGTTNKAALFAAGLGASAAEADLIAQNILGNGAAWKLGSLFNTTAVTVSNNINLPFSSHTSFATAHSTRPKLVYVGADDGMLHAFYFETGPNGEAAGSEAWAYVPPSLLASRTALFAAGGQSSDPTKHTYGFASSPKVDDACVAPCSAQTDWKTVLVSGAGPGSTSYFALDITNPTASPPFSVLWRSTTATNFANKVGQSWSVPAFAFVGNGATFQSALLFGSGYDTTPADGQDQGNYTFIVNPVTGGNITAPFHTTAPGSMLTTFALLPDLAVANDPSSTKAIAAYQADLGGRIWRFAGATATPSSALYDAGANHPFYYSPAVSALNGTDVVLAAADKTFDDTDVNPATGAITSALYIVTDRNGTASAATPLLFTSICKSGCHAGSCTGCPTFNNLARPVSSPVLLTNLDPSATSPLQVLLEIYQPVPNSCSLGGTSLVVVDVDTSATTPVLKMSEAKTVPGAGRSAGIFIGAGGVLVSGASGTGDNSSSVSVIAGAPAVIGGGGSGTVGNAQLLGITETNN